MTLDEQQAIVSFGERASLLNEERAEELASILTPMLEGANKARLSGHANWLIGERPEA